MYRVAESPCAKLFSGLRWRCHMCRPVEQSLSTWPWRRRSTMPACDDPIRRMAQNGATTHEIERQGRWKQGGGMVGRYTRGESSGSALR